jgi:hypothetical protein
MRHIDLSGPDGNAFALMGLAKNWGKQLGKDTRPIIGEMLSGDYNNLVNVMKREFGSIATFEGNDEADDECGCSEGCNC